MLRDDDARVTVRDLRRWFLPAFILLLGLVLFFLQIRKTATSAAPIPVEMSR
jgi:cytochrome c-type biogenesis protein CcmH/NrfF